MKAYNDYIKEIKHRKKQNLKAKPIDNAELANEIILQIKDPDHIYRKASLNFLIYNILPGTTAAAGP